MIFDYLICYAFTFSILHSYSKIIYLFTTILLFYREVKEILLNQEFQRPILPTKHSDSSEVCFLDIIGQGNPWLDNIFILPKKKLYTILSSFELKICEKFAERVVILTSIS